MNKLNRSQLAEFCSVNLGTIDNWVREGCPYIRRPIRQGVGQWEFNAKDVFEWRLIRERNAILGDLAGVDESEARRRKLAAEAGLAELQLRKASGEVVSIADSAREWMQMVGAARARILAIPSKLCRSIAIEKDPIVCQQMITDSLHEALRELASYPDVPEPVEEPAAVEVPAVADMPATEVKKTPKRGKRKK